MKAEFRPETCTRHETTQNTPLKGEWLKHSLLKHLPTAEKYKMLFLSISKTRAVSSNVKLVLFSVKDVPPFDARSQHTAPIWIWKNTLCHKYKIRCKPFHLHQQESHLQPTYCHFLGDVSIKKWGENKFVICSGVPHTIVRIVFFSKRVAGCHDCSLIRNDYSSRICVPEQGTTPRSDKIPWIRRKRRCWSLRERRRAQDDTRA